ncbi:ester cyclase [Phaeobacter inhibens]|uniref:ester cyclase n=1 Tax=Phaeobacter inhibens TaxID=221822 RepID=UPI000C9B5141|nr:ester cyclase [Phaeobacter inhibens]AUQ55319.1 SnoaL-like domain protein [Phaeobacter inhibens]AUQ79335.1 SnoaL-like domain protein [Phaeobacter inhibens]AUR16494.1 SnoaL-like domain protein [Phaeobacter inhibens]
MNDLQAAKAVVRAFYADLDAPDANLEAALIRHTSPDYLWRGFHPFNEMTEAAEVARQFWAPLRKSLTSLQRREDIFFAGRNQMDDFQGIWVVSMGHLMGLFDAPFVNIPPMGKIAMLRYCEFHRVEDGKIAQTAMYFDLPHLMAQAGVTAFPGQTAAQLVQPGPMTHDGLLFEAQPDHEGETTLAVINRMIGELGQWDNKLSLEDELRQTWCEDMLWWGPTGIGATYTIERYAQQHSGPFRAAFSDRSRTGHTARLAEGAYGGFAGWPNFTARLTGDFMGRTATNERGEFRVIDIYRRSGDKLAENWIFIDLLHFWKGQGYDVLQQLSDGTLT